MKKIIILGSTGSVGCNALEVIRCYKDKFRIVGLSANTNYKLLADQAHEFKVKNTAINKETLASDLKAKLLAGAKVFTGNEGICRMVRETGADLVLIAIGGTESIRPVVEAVSAGKDIAIASKEALVSAGALVSKIAKKNNVNILPVDSEHSAIFQCLNGGGRDFLRKIYLTGSGGPLRNVKKTRFDKLPVSRVISHPKWNMGKKITVDSATLMNKGLEVIEAKWLFNIDTKDIEVILHPEALIHSMVELIDGTVLANLSCPDMRFPILYALSYPERLQSSLKRIDFLKVKKLTFEKPDHKKFPALRLAYKASASESASAVLNAANEEAVSHFLNGKIRFSGIVKTVEKVLNRHKKIKHPSLNEILDIDNWAKEETRRLI